MKRLRDLGAKVIIVHVDQFATKGTPDLIGCYRGIALALEIKDPNGDAPTIHQRRQLQQWYISGAQTGVLTAKAEVDIIVAKVDGFLENPDTKLYHFESPQTPS